MSSECFEVEGEYVELNQLLKLVGFCSSGGEGKHLVAAGLVEVDGHVETRMRCKIRPGQRIRFAGKEVSIVAAGA
ncbi:MAG TPA: RNA-binding S4 domain-containing protein [Flavobacteriales bacterium]|nr:RNA-binding S4 domain-containing protein [Flavobacteriales bacterium]HNU57835.1 RNA-binding S4 domain-containing protein [Flavobacteriales bacterium]